MIEHKLKFKEMKRLKEKKKPEPRKVLNLFTDIFFGI